MTDFGGFSFLTHPRLRERSDAIQARLGHQGASLRDWIASSLRSSQRRSMEVLLLTTTEIGGFSFLTHPRLRERSDAIQAEFGKTGLVDRQHPVAVPTGALRASKIVPDDFVVATLLAMTRRIKASRKDIG